MWWWRTSTTQWSLWDIYRARRGPGWYFLPETVKIWKWCICIFWAWISSITLPVGSEGMRLSVWRSTGMASVQNGGCRRGVCQCRVDRIEEDKDDGLLPLLVKVKQYRAGGLGWWASLVGCHQVTSPYIYFFFCFFFSFSVSYFEISNSNLNLFLQDLNLGYLLEWI
jgi:hypothetical protein